MNKLAEDINILSTRLGTFSNRFNEDPVYALDWAGTAFENAAERGVLTEIYQRLATGASIDDINVEATKHVVDGARFPSRSNLPCANLMAQCKAKAWGDIINFLHIVKDE